MVWAGSMSDAVSRAAHLLSRGGGSGDATLALLSLLRSLPASASPAALRRLCAGVPPSLLRPPRWNCATDAGASASVERAELRYGLVARLASTAAASEPAAAAPLARCAALAAAAGFALGNFAHTFFAVVGLSALIASSATAFACVKYAGALYLVYLGVRMLRSDGQCIGLRLACRPAQALGAGPGQQQHAGQHQAALARRKAHALRRKARIKQVELLGHAVNPHAARRRWRTAAG